MRPLRGRGDALEISTCETTGPGEARVVSASPSGKGSGASCSKETRAESVPAPPCEAIRQDRCETGGPARALPSLGSPPPGRAAPRALAFVRPRRG